MKHANVLNSEAFVSKFSTLKMLVNHLTVQEDHFFICSVHTSSLVKPPMTTTPLSVGEVTIVDPERLNGSSGPK